MSSPGSWVSLPPARTTTPPNLPSSASPKPPSTPSTPSGAKRDRLGWRRCSTFTSASTQEGGIAETNLLWLGGLCLESLNAFYLRPFDYRFYRSLDNPMAKRLYKTWASSSRERSRKARSAWPCATATCANSSPSPARPSSPNPRRSSPQGTKSSPPPLSWPTWNDSPGKERTGWCGTGQAPGPCGSSRSCRTARSGSFSGSRSTPPKGPRTRPGSAALPRTSARSYRIPKAARSMKRWPGVLAPVARWRT